MGFIIGRGTGHEGVGGGGTRETRREGEGGGKEQAGKEGVCEEGQGEGEGERPGAVAEQGEPAGSPCLKVFNNI